MKPSEDFIGRKGLLWHMILNHSPNKHAMSRQLCNTCSILKGKEREWKEKKGRCRKAAIKKTAQSISLLMGEKDQSFSLHGLLPSLLLVFNSYRQANWRQLEGRRQNLAQKAGPGAVFCWAVLVMVGSSLLLHGTQGCETARWRGVGRES